MFTYNIKAGTADVSVTIRIIDSTDGTPETGVVWNTAGIDMQYRREGAVSTAITEATLAALTTAHTDGGFLHIGNGYYRLDLPDAAVADGVTGVLVHGTVTGMVVIGCYVHIVDYDPFDSVRMGLTALPNAAADAAGGLPVSDLGGLDLDAMNTNINDIETDTADMQPKLGTITDLGSGATIGANLVDIEAQTDDIGSAGAGLTALAQASVCTEARLSELDAATGGKMANQVDVIEADTTALNDTKVPDTISLVNINAEVDTALADIDMDHFIQVTAGVEEPTIGSYLDQIMHKDGSQTFSQTTDSLEASRDKLTDIETDTAEIGTAGAGLSNINLPNQTMDITGSLSGSVGSVTGNVTGSVGSVAAGGITASSIATDAIGSDELAASAAQKIRDEILPTQNVAFSNIEFLWVAASDHVTPVTAASGTSVTRSIDGGAFGAATGTLAEVGNGIYQFDASQADMNGGIITFRFVATGGTPGAPDDAFVTIVTGGGV